MNGEAMSYLLIFTGAMKVKVFFCIFLLFHSISAWTFVASGEKIYMKEKVLRVSPEKWKKISKDNFFQVYAEDKPNKLNPKLLKGPFGEKIAKKDLSRVKLDKKALEFLHDNPNLKRFAKYDLELNEDALYIGESEQFLKYCVLRDALIIHDAFVDSASSLDV